ncbi:MAG: trypsin-like peptidase domain-containing protein, partial [Solirubrobacteraceae bacterium]|nr:trypsin-like peptidase domain-containing protein [Solirubrobacteraceae bacterium]
MERERQAWKGWIVLANPARNPTSEPWQGDDVGATDAFLLDAYSQTVSDVVERLGPSVAAVQVGDTGTAGSGGGSGFLFTPDGYLLTNSHVVRAGKTAFAPGEAKPAYRVSLADAREYSARWVGDDPDTDLAVLHIDGLSQGRLSHAPLGTSVGLKR